MSTRAQLVRLIGRAVSAGLRSSTRAARSSPRTAGSSGRGSSGPAVPSSGRGSGTDYPGDFSGEAVIEYGPRADGAADPGEVVWAWVPFEEDHTRGKDRPALVVGRDGRWLLALMLTSRDRDRPGPGPERARGDGVWLDVGTGAWDAQRRPSEVRLDRVVRLAPDAVRREGAALDRHRFDEVAAALADQHGWARPAASG